MLPTSFHRVLGAAVAATMAAAVAATPAGAQLSIGTAPDPSGGYVGPFGAAASGGTGRFAQTFVRPAAGFDLLQTFTFNLGDFNPDGSGAGLRFRASVYAVSGPQLGARLYQSDLRSGSGNFVGFDPYAFAPNVTLAPGATTFALVLEAAGGPATAQDVIAAGTPPFADPGLALYTVDDAGTLRDTGAQAAFTATLVSTPEPATLALVAGALAGVAAVARGRRPR